MAVNPLVTWRNTLVTAIPPVADTSWAANLSAWAGLNTAAMQLTDITNAVFIFNQGVFTAQLLALVTPLDNKATALQNFVDAWGTAIMASTMTVSGGSDNTGFTLINATGVPNNLAAAKAILFAALMAGTNVVTIFDSEFSPAFRTGFLSLTYQVTGTGFPPGGPSIIPYSHVSGTI